MSNQRDNFYEVFEKLRKRVSNNLYLKRTGSGQIIIRSDINTSFEASLFIEAFEVITQSRFVLDRQSQGNNEFRFDGVWICTRGKHEIGAKKKCEKCCASIKIVIKMLPENGECTDSFLKLSPPLPAIIFIYPKHNHSLYQINPMANFDVSEEIKLCFHEYFRRGFVGIDAKRIHEGYLIKSNWELLGNVQMNPPLRYIYKLYERWEQANNLGICVDDELYEKLRLTDKYLLDEDDSQMEDFTFENIIDDILADLNDEQFPVKYIKENGSECGKRKLNDENSCSEIKVKCYRSVSQNMHERIGSQSIVQLNDHESTENRNTEKQNPVNNIKKVSVNYVPTHTQSRAAIFNSPVIVVCNSALRETKSLSNFQTSRALPNRIGFLKL